MTSDEAALLHNQFVEVRSKLDGLAATLESHRDRSTQEHQAMRDLIGQLFALLHGDGSEGKPGVIGRIERLETESRIIKRVGAAAAAAIGAIGGAISGVIRFGPPGGGGSGQ